MAHVDLAVLLIWNVWLQHQKALDDLSGPVGLSVAAVTRLFLLLLLGQRLGVAKVVLYGLHVDLVFLHVLFGVHRFEDVVLACFSIGCRLHEDRLGLFDSLLLQLRVDRLLDFGRVLQVLLLKYTLQLPRLLVELPCDLLLSHSEGVRQTLLDILCQLDLTWLGRLDASLVLLNREAVIWIVEGRVD